MALFSLRRNIQEGNIGCLILALIFSLSAIPRVRGYLMLIGLICLCRLMLFFLLPSFHGIIPPLVR